MHPIPVLLTIAVVVAVTAGVLRLHRWLLSLEERGLIRYVRKPPGRASNMFLEIDKFTRPSVEFIQQAEDPVVESQTDDGH